MTENEPIKNSQLYPPEKNEGQEVKKGKKFKPLHLVTWVLVLSALYSLFNEDIGITFFILSNMPWHESLSIVMEYVGVFILGVASVFLSFKTHVLLHELGHAGAGLLVKKKLILISVGRWRYERTLRGFRFRKGVHIAGAAGVTAMADDITQQIYSPKVKATVHLSGGALSNIVLGGLVFLLAHLWVEHRLISALLTIFAGMGLLLGVMNLLPLKIQGWETDGFQIRKTLQGRGNIVDEKSTYLASAIYCDLPAKNWPEEKLPTVAEIEAEGVSTLTKMSAYTVRFEYAFAKHRTDMKEESALWLAKYFNDLPDGVRQQVAYQQCVFAVLEQKDAALFQAWRPHCVGGLFNLEPYLHWVDAEHAFMVGDTKQTRMYIEKARDTLLDLSVANTKEFIEGRLNQLDKQLLELA